MSIAKIIEVSAEGKTIEDAIQSAVTEVSKTIKHIKQIDIEHIHANVQGNKVVTYRVLAKVSFVIES